MRKQHREATVMMAVAMGGVRADAAILARNVVWPCAVGRQGQGGSTGRAIRCGRPAGRGVQLEVQCTATRGHPGDRGATPEKARQKGGLAEENKRERGSLDGAGAESESDGTARHGTAHAGGGGQHQMSGIWTADQVHQRGKATQAKTARRSTPLSPPPLFRFVVSPAGCGESIRQSPSHRIRPNP